MQRRVTAQGCVPLLAAPPNTTELRGIFYSILKGGGAGAKGEVEFRPESVGVGLAHQV